MYVIMDKKINTTNHTPELYTHDCVSYDDMNQIDVYYANQSSNSFVNIK